MGTPTDSLAVETSAEELITQPAKPRQPAAEQWKVNAIGNFLLDLYHKRFITAQKKWQVDKIGLRAEFHKYLTGSPVGADLSLRLGSANGSTDIGSLLHRTNFLINTPRGCNFYRINNVSLYHYRTKKRNELDERQKNDDPPTLAMTNSGGKESGILNLEQLCNDNKVDEKSENFHLAYQRTKIQSRKNDFTLSSMGCYICQLNFDKIEEYEEHVEYHGDETDFKSLETMDKFTSSMLEVYYQLCINSHYFCFTLEAKLQNVIIEKIIIVKSETFYYVTANLPQELPLGGKYQFFVDSHMFTIYLEQPIVIVFRQQETDRIVEQHHFIRTETFPVVNFAVSPYRLSNSKLFKEKFILESYIPNIKRTIKDDENIIKLAQNFKNKKDVTKDNFIESFTLMLQIEDVEKIITHKSLTQTKVRLRQIANAKELSIQLKDIRNEIYLENVLSPYDDVAVITEDPTQQTSKLVENDFDKLFSNFVNDRKKPKAYFGHVERVKNRRVTFKCDSKIQISENKTYTIIFRPSRIILRRQYRALQLLRCIGDEILKRFLYPDKEFEIDRTMISLAIVDKLELKNHTIYENPEQLKAVQQIVASNRLNAPYIVFGPPGTGKTTTIVEAIYQLLVLRPETRILVTAGSNSACDEIAIRLLRNVSNYGVKSLTRIYSRTNEKRIENIDELLLEYSNMYNAHFYPDVETLHAYRIVVCTLAVAGKLATGKFGKDEDGAPLYTHIFVDEASASTETEILMGIVCAMSPRASLILSGDPKQLCPIVQSVEAKHLGLGISLMERLMRRDGYQMDESGNYNHEIQTRLRRNYRSHPAIVNLYNSLYYNNELISLAPKDEVNAAANWHLAPNPDFPILFHAEFGTSQHGQNSVSLANIREVDAVMDYVKDFMYFGINGEKITEKDIGIISPYKNQCRRIQEQLTQRNWHNIECGSVETFQGKEKNIIIVSFVRSFTKTLGFLDDPRRLNVTLSRPRSLLILIGNPRTLSLNSDYKYVIDTCKIHNTLVGAPYFEEYSEDDMKLLKDSFSALIFTNSNCKTPKTKNMYPKSSKSNRKNKAHLNQEDKLVGSDYKKPDDDTVQLGQSMKKHINPISQQKQREKIRTFKNIIEMNEKQKTQLPGKMVSEMDTFFAELPLVPNSTSTTAEPHSSTTLRKPSPKPVNFNVLSVERKPALTPQNSQATLRDSTPTLQNSISANKKPIPMSRNSLPIQQNSVPMHQNHQNQTLTSQKSIRTATPTPVNPFSNQRKPTTYTDRNPVPRLQTQSEDANRTSNFNPLGTLTSSYSSTNSVRPTAATKTTANTPYSKSHSDKLENAARILRESHSNATCHRSQHSAAREVFATTTTTTHVRPNEVQMPYEYRPITSPLSDPARRGNVITHNRIYAAETRRQGLREQKKKSTCILM